MKIEQVEEEEVTTTSHEDEITEITNGKVKKI
jgi:hypothetical protein